MVDLMMALKNLHAGIFLKTEPIAELMLAIKRTAKGERWVSSGAALSLVENQHAKEDHEKQRHEHLKTNARIWCCAGCSKV